jgi:hypothetical protein
MVRFDRWDRLDRLDGLVGYMGFIGHDEIPFGVFIAEFHRINFIGCLSLIICRWSFGISLDPWNP